MTFLNDSTDNNLLAALCPGLPGWAGIKGKNLLDFAEARDSGWQWHHLDHMEICTSLQIYIDANTPSLSFSCRPPNQQHQGTEGKNDITEDNLQFALKTFLAFANCSVFLISLQKLCNREHIVCSYYYCLLLFEILYVRYQKDLLPSCVKQNIILV